MDRYEKAMKNLEDYVGELKRDIDNLSEKKPCPCKALEMDDNACDKFSDEENWRINDDISKSCRNERKASF